VRALGFESIAYGSKGLMGFENFYPDMPKMPFLEYYENCKMQMMEKLPHL